MQFFWVLEVKGCLKEVDLHLFGLWSLSIGRKRRNIFGDRKVGTCLEFEKKCFPEEKEKEGNIWRRKMFGVGKYFVLRGKVKGGKYLERENIWKREIFGKGKGGKYLVKGNFLSFYPGEG